MFSNSIFIWFTFIMSEQFSYHSNKEVSEVYDVSRAMSWSMSDAWKNQILNASQASSHEIKQAVDLWCWTWRFIPLLIEVLDQASITWMEPSKHMIWQAIDKKYSKDVKFVNRWIEATWLESDRFDLAFMSMVYHHIPNKEKAVEEIRRILKNDWIFFMRNSTKDTLSLEPRTKYFPSALKVELDRSCTREEILNHFKDWWMKLISSWSVQQVAWSNGKDYFDKISKRWLSSLQSINDWEFKDWVDKMKEIRSIEEQFLEPVDYFVFKK